jgi:uncharacterized damage-inducible protein DinB
MNTPLLATLENSRQYTLHVAALMPEADYSFKPADEVWSFGALIHHIAYGILWWEANYIKGKQSEWAPPAIQHSKKEINAYLETAYDSLKKTLSNGKLSDEAVNGFHATLDHITHHRGQAVTYLRCRGIVPPEYVY